jgi:hypothetical protein
MKATTGAMSCFRNNTMMAEMILQKKLKGPEGLSLPCNFFTRPYLFDLPGFLLFLALNGATFYCSPHPKKPTHFSK